MSTPTPDGSRPADPIVSPPPPTGTPDGQRPPDPIVPPDTTTPPDNSGPGRGGRG